MKERNSTADVLRGIAILLVILGHTISGCVDEYGGTLVYSIIWSLQMPLFFLVSGYVTRYGMAVTDGKYLKQFALKKTAAYMIPWFMWSFLIRGIVLGETSFLNIKYLLWHMDVGYWFLPSLWMMVLAYGLSQFVAAKVIKDDNKWWQKLTVTLTCFTAIAVLLLMVGLATGLSFLGIKLTVYYMPFYALGVIFGKLQEQCVYQKCLRRINIAAAIAVVVYFVLIAKFDLFLLGETIPEIAIRVLASLTGCSVVCFCITKVPVWKRLTLCGIHSLELYVALIHSCAW